MKTRSHLEVAALIAIAALIALIGITRVPLESHEAFVLASAQSMFDRQDWVVPRFNGELRLTKPPLSYWLTALTAYLAGGLDPIQPWHGRLPSALAAVGIVALTIDIGRRAFGARHGLLAGLVLATSSGYYYYAHSARPEMVYAFLCTAALACHIRAGEAPDCSASQRIFGLLIWVLFALATLTKGPQIPAVFFVAFAVDAWLRERNLRGALRRLQPLVGLIVLALISLPWWWLLEQKVGSLRGSQLSGSLLKPTLKSVLDPYYLYRPLQLLLPWTLLLPALWAVSREKLTEDFRLMLILTGLSALALSFGPQKRWYYMLPALAPMSLVLAGGIAELLRRVESRSDWPRHARWIFLAVPALFIAAINTPLVRSDNKSAEESLAVAARAEVAQGRQLVLWDVSGSSEVFVYYARQRVLAVDSAEDLQNLVTATGSPRFSVVTTTAHAGELPLTVRHELVKRIKRRGSDLVLLRVDHPAQTTNGILIPSP